MVENALLVEMLIAFANDAVLIVRLLKIRKLVMGLYDWIKATTFLYSFKKMDEVLKHLCENVGITFFHFARRFTDGRYFELTTDR